VSVEVSYREDVIEGPDLALIGEPYYEPFDIPRDAVERDRC
jgi:hypothetical protein